MQGKGRLSSLTAPLQSLQLSLPFHWPEGIWESLSYGETHIWKDTALKQGPLSEITISGIPWVENSSLAAVITLFAVCVVRSLISTNLE